MFENLSDKLQRAFKDLRGQGTLTDENINDALRQIRLALLESDVNLNVAKDVIDRIREKALGTQVTTALSPSEQIVKIVRDELVALLGTDTARFKFAPQPPTVILMAGLQGSGKTTTSGKLAQWLKKGGHRPMLVSVDVYRPAAREQLKVVAESVGVPSMRAFACSPRKSTVTYWEAMRPRWTRDCSSGGTCAPAGLTTWPRPVWSGTTRIGSKVPAWTESPPEASPLSVMALRA